MKKLVIVATLLAATLAGCGSTGLPTARALQAKPAQAASKSLATKVSTPGYKVTKVTFEVLEAAPFPGHNYNVRQRFDFEGVRDGKPFNVTLFSINPDGNFFVALVDKLVVNGEPVTGKAAFAALAPVLRGAVNAQGNQPAHIGEAASILVHSSM